MSAPNNQKELPVTVTAEDLQTKSVWSSSQSPKFEDAFNEHWDRVYEVLFRIVGERAEAEDLSLETFLRLYNRPPKFESWEKLAGWLYRVATNLGFNALRSRKRRSRYEEEAGHLAMDVHAAPDPAKEAERLEEIQRVRQILSLMKPRDAKLLILRNSGFSYTELAVTLEVAPGSIGTLLVRAEADFEKRYRRID
ncbi:MAG: sigma-70 family RNA polymerase sigma factor [Anaerolineales bacterium]|jgi:RNA polymerase sigma-70 factor (ECF subfamily)|nr:sigma-70 family RNA polymerase sigma factor [Anaerolineales bacterium]